VVVLGGGVAGLAAARACHEAGARVQVLEGRDRLGGRVLTHREPAAGPIELGAEFVHGKAEEMQPHVTAAGLRVVDVTGRRWQTSARGLRPTDHFWTQLERVMRHLDEDMEPDRSFASFLADRPGGRQAAEARRMAAQFVEGFQAADLRIVSARSLAGKGSPSGDPEAQRIGRVFEGYDRFVSALAEPIERCVRLRSTVLDVRWSRGRLRVNARVDGRRTARFDARAAIVALPLGVLTSQPGDAGHVRFDPVIGRLARPLAALAVGHVTKVVLRCREPFWERARRAASARHEALTTMGFIHAPGEPFPVWWTGYPDRSAAMVAWCGGPDAPRLSRTPEAALRQRLIATLARIFGLPRRTVAAQILGVWRHDWDGDPRSAAAPTATLRSAVSSRCGFWPGLSMTHSSSRVKPPSRTGALERWTERWRRGSERRGSCFEERPEVRSER
jgi:monoamine oxidase